MRNDENDAILIPENMTKGYNVTSTKIHFRTCYKSEGKILVRNYLTSLQVAVGNTKKYIASRRVMFDDAREFLRQYQHVVGNSRILHTWDNDNYDYSNVERDNRDFVEGKNIFIVDNASNEQENSHIPERREDTDVNKNKGEDLMPSMISNLESILKNYDAVANLFVEKDSPVSYVEKASVSKDEDILFQSSK